MQLGTYAVCSRFSARERAIERAGQEGCMHLAQLNGSLLPDSCLSSVRDNVSEYPDLHPGEMRATWDAGV